MQTLLPPGVYVQRRESAARVRPVRTDVAAFVGIAERGPIHTPRRVESWREYVATFGERFSAGFLPDAAQGFFDNGGSTCWIVRVADPNTVKYASAKLMNHRDTPTIELKAIDPGTGGIRISFVVASRPRSRFALTLRVENRDSEFWDNLSTDSDDPRYFEKLINGPKSNSEDAFNSNDTTSSEDAFNSALELRRDSERGSLLIRARDLKSFSSTPQAAEGRLEIESAGSRNQQSGDNPDCDGLKTLVRAHITGVGAPAGTKWGLQTLDGYPDISLVAIPDIMRTDNLKHKFKPPPELNYGASQQQRDQRQQERERVRQLERQQENVPRKFDLAEILRMQHELTRDCERHRRFAVLDMPPELVRDIDDPQKILAYRETFRSRYAALYYPWIRVNDPQERGVIRDLPPSGHVCGVIALVDQTVGVHKPPANEVIQKVADVTVRVDDEIHGLLNGKHVNVIRPIPGRELRIMGARTVANPNDDSEWRFINVRRLISMIERFAEVELRKIAFDVNNQEVWSDIRRVLRGLFDELWRRGMLDGATPDEAWSVICDETNNPPEEIDAGRLHCDVQLLPPHPAEYVYLRIGRTKEGTEIIEIKGAEHAANR